MNRAVLLVLSTLVLATSAHAQLFRRQPSNEQQEQLMRQLQQQGAGGMQGFQMPSREEMEQLQRDSAEMQRLSTEMQRLQRLGRYDEAQALSKRLDELMQCRPDVAHARAAAWAALRRSCGSCRPARCPKA